MFDNINTNASKKDSGTSGNSDKTKSNNIAPPPIPPKIPTPEPSSSNKPANKQAGVSLSTLPTSNAKPAKPKLISPPALTTTLAPNTPDKKKEDRPRKGVEDIFADTETGPRNSGFSKKPDVFKPKEEARPTTDGTDGFNAEDSGSKSRSRRLIMLIILGVGLAVITVGGILSYKILTEDNAVLEIEETSEPDIIINKKKEPEPPIVDINNTIPPDDIVNPEIKVEPDIKIEENSEPPMVDTNIDSDEDGLLDSEEIELGTNINNKDSDSDGLFDREEVKVYKTDPLNPDTDGDGYLDGDEVNNNFNPLGAGKLYEL